MASKYAGIAEEGHEVTIVTPMPIVGFELQRTAADLPLRKRLAQLGVRVLAESAILEWTGDGARVVSFLDGSEQLIEANALVLATTNMANDGEARALDDKGIAHRLIGDAAAARLAPYAIYEGRKAGLEI